jgi:hypothetical protein
MGFSKGTLHYMKQNARSDKTFTLNAYVREGEVGELGKTELLLVSI